MLYGLLATVQPCLEGMRMDLASGCLAFADVATVPRGTLGRDLCLDERLFRRMISRWDTDVIATFVRPLSSCKIGSPAQLLAAAAAPSSSATNTGTDPPTPRGFAPAAGCARGEPGSCEGTPACWDPMVVSPSGFFRSWTGQVVCRIVQDSIRNRLVPEA